MNLEFVLHRKEGTSLWRSTVRIEFGSEGSFVERKAQVCRKEGTNIIFHISHETSDPQDDPEIIQWSIQIDSSRGGLKFEAHPQNDSVNFWKLQCLFSIGYGSPSYRQHPGNEVYRPLHTICQLVSSIGLRVARYRWYLCTRRNWWYIVLCWLLTDSRPDIPSAHLRDSTCRFSPPGMSSLWLRLELMPSSRSHHAQYQKTSSTWVTLAWYLWLSCLLNEVFGAYPSLSFV